MGEDRLRVKRFGLVGVGAWGKRYIETIRRRQDCRIVAFVRSSRNVEAAVPDARACASWQELIELGKTGFLDGVIVATTPESQAEIAGAATQAGIAALVEKPLGLSRATVEAVYHFQKELARPAPLIVDYIHLFAPAYQALRSLVLTAHAANNAIVAIDSVGCAPGPSRSSCPPLYDYGPHDIGMCLDLLGTDAPFRLHSARKVPSVLDARGELLEASFDLGGAKVNIRVGNGASAKARRLSVSLSAGSVLVYDDCQPHPMKLTNDGRPVPVAETPALDAVVTFFIEQLSARLGKDAGPPHPAASLPFSMGVAGILDAIAGSLTVL